MKINYGLFGYGRLNGKIRVNCINYFFIEIRFKRREWNFEKYYEKYLFDKIWISVFIRWFVWVRCVYIGCDWCGCCKFDNIIVKYKNFILI